MSDTEAEEEEAEEETAMTGARLQRIRARLRPYVPADAEWIAERKAMRLEDARRSTDCA